MDSSKIEKLWAEFENDIPDMVPKAMVRKLFSMVYLKGKCDALKDENLLCRTMIGMFLAGTLFGFGWCLLLINYGILTIIYN